MVKYINLWRSDRMVKVRLRKKPKGFAKASFTDVPKTKKDKEYWKKKYKIKIGLIPYADRKGKVMYYKKKSKGRKK